VPLTTVGGGEDRAVGSGVIDSRSEETGRRVFGAWEEGGGVIDEWVAEDPATSIEVVGDAERAISTLAGSSRP
jgi:hypothetical protein